MRAQRAISGLFETIANLSDKDFIIYATYDTGLSRISVDVYKNKDNPEDFDDLVCYTNEGIAKIHALEDELISIHNAYKGK